VDHALLERRAAQLAAHGTEPPSPGPIPPIFERFTTQARAAIDAAVEHARRAKDRWVEPAHLLFGVLDAEAGVAAAVRTRYGWHRPPALPPDSWDTSRYRPDPEHGNVFTYTEPPYSPATGIFTPEARRIVAEDVLIIAERLDHPALTTGHVLLAILERYAYLTIDFISALPPIREITAAVTGALPGQEDT
jgi:ATP-dependent Clp protease ATP-binding subunit ClpA